MEDEKQTLNALHMQAALVHLPFDADKLAEKGVLLNGESITSDLDTSTIKPGDVFTIEGREFGGEKSYKLIVSESDKRGGNMAAFIEMERDIENATFSSKKPNNIVTVYPGFNDASLDARGAAEALNYAIDVLGGSSVNVALVERFNASLLDSLKAHHIAPKDANVTCVSHAIGSAEGIMSSMGLHRAGVRSGHVLLNPSDLPDALEKALEVHARALMDQDPSLSAHDAIWKNIQGFFYNATTYYGNDVTTSALADTDMQLTKRTITLEAGYTAGSLMALPKGSVKQVSEGVSVEVLTDAINNVEEALTKGEEKSLGKKLETFLKNIDFNFAADDGSKEPSGHGLPDTVKEAQKSDSRSRQ
jgi:hypothetical protein